MTAFRRFALQKLFTHLHPQCDVNSDECVQYVESQLDTFKQSPVFEFHQHIMREHGYQSLLRWDLSAEALTSLADEIMDRTQTVLNQIASIPLEQHTFQNTLLPLAIDEYQSSVLSSCVDFVKHVNPIKELRDASTLADTKLSAFAVECGMREDVYHSVKAYASRYTQSMKQHCNDMPLHTPEEQRFLDRVLRDFTRNGLHLEEAARSKIKSLKQRVSELCIQFSKNLGEDNATFQLKPEQLAGLPDDFIDARPTTEDGLVIVDLKYPTYFPIARKCSVPETRALLEKAFSSRCKNVNTPILEEVALLRYQIAALMGYSTHADYILEIRMAKSPHNVRHFLNELQDKLQPLAEKEMETLLSLKKVECEYTGREFDGVLQPYDFQYYHTMRQEKEFQVDHEEIKKYFPLQIVLKGMLELYQTILGLSFSLVENAHVWHEDVQYYRATDAETGKLVGHFYLDLHPRDGKYGHAACFGLSPACFDEHNEWKTPIAACVCNFPKPTPSKPSLLSHSDFVTILHEFGHCMHQICSLARFSRFSGTRVERDFVEAPSQMLENWCWEKESIELMSGHFETGERLPLKHLSKLIAAKNADVALLTKRQIVFATFDQVLHSSSELVNTAKLYSDIAEKIIGIKPTADTNFAASFAHLTGGYDASYYSYLYSEVFSEDMYQTGFGSMNLFDSVAGLKYRQEILSRGGSMDAVDMLRNFLGRAPSKDAFLRSKGLLA